MARLLTIALALIVALGGAIVWSGGGGAERVDFSFINRGDIINLDPNQMSWLQDMRIALAMWEGLYSYDPMTLAPVPGVAERVEVSADSRVWTFRLRDSARWSDGSPVVAGDFVFAWKRMLDEPGEYTYLHYYIAGAEAYVNAAARGERPDYATVGVKAPDARTLRVELTNPVTFFPDLVAFPPFFPLHEKSMAKFRQVDGRTGRVSYRQQFTRPPDVVTNGAFVLKRWDFKRRLVLEKNRWYWDAVQVKSNVIEMVVVEDPLTQLMLYESGAVQWLSEVPSEVAPELIAQKRPDMHNFPGFGTMFLTLMVRPTLRDGRPNPLSDERIRQALAMSIDREQIVRNILRCGERAATTYIPPDIFAPLGWRSTPGLGFDPSRARKLLADAGYPDGGRLPGVSYLYRSGSQVSRELAQNYARQWKQNLGLEIPLEQLEAKMASQRIRDREYTISGANWTGDYNDPSTFTDKYLSDAINNDSSWNCPEYDELVRKAAKETNAQSRLRLLESAERLINEQVPISPIYHTTNQYLFRRDVKGINLVPRNMTMLKAVYRE